MILLLELLNLPVSLLTLPNNNDGYPATFPTPSFGDYLSDLNHFLRTHMPYAEDLFQSTVHKFLFAEMLFMYFFFIAGLRRYLVAHVFLLLKVIAIAIIVYSPGASA